MSDPQLLWRKVWAATIDTLRGRSRGQYDIRLARPQGIEGFFAGLPQSSPTSLGGFEIVVPLASVESPIPVPPTALTVAYIGSRSKRADWRIPSQRPDTAYPLWREGVGLLTATQPGTHFIALVRDPHDAYHARWLRPEDVEALPVEIGQPMTNGNAGVERIDPAQWPSVAVTLSIATTPGSGRRAARVQSETDTQSQQTYRWEDETIATAQRDPFEVDPDVVDRGLASHRRTQNSLAQVLLDAGLKPRSYRRGVEPAFDLGWAQGNVFYVAEIKSITNANEEKQLRLALGQVLRYAHRLAEKTEPIQPVIATERRPLDTSWMALCENLGVVLSWPESFTDLLDT